MNKRIASIISIICLLLAGICCIGFGSSTVNATLSPQDEANFSNNDILFYEPCAEGSDGGVEICGTNKNYAGKEVWTKNELKAVKANAPFYKKAADKYGIAWQILAVIHQRETSLARTNGDNGQGAYQFYSADERARCKGGSFSPGKISDEQFQIQSYCIADFVKNNYGKGLDLSKDDDIKKMFFRYNGTAGAYKSQALKLGFSQAEADRGEGSPYVMNRYDAKREPSGSWCQIKTDLGSMECPANKDFGAFVYYKAITCGGTDGSDSVLGDTNGGSAGGLSDGSTSLSDTSGGSFGSGDGSGVSCNGGDEGSMNLNAAAVALAWPEGSKHDVNYPSGSASEAFEKAHKKFTSGSSDACAKRGASCDMFVSTVVRYSGYDKNYPLGDVVAQYNYAKNHPKLWEVIDWSDGSKSKVKPGDIIIEKSKGHTAMIVQDKDGKIKVAAASHCDYFPHIKPYYTPRQSAWLIRATGANNSTSGVSMSDGVTSSSTDGTISSSGQNNGDVNASALAMAWPEDDYKKHFRKEPTKLFSNYYKSLSGDDANDCSKKGKGCASFVNTTLLYAGAKTTGNSKTTSIDSLLSELQADSAWSEVNPAGDRIKESDLKPGDVLFYYKSSSNPAENSESIVYHVAIFVKTSDGGRIAQANKCTSFGYVSKKNMPDGKSDIKVFRWKNQDKTKDVACDVCAGRNNGEAGLKAGGMTLAEAKEFMKNYHDAAMKKYYKKRGDVVFEGASIHDAGCPFGPLNNCVAFSQWFINKYTTAGPKWGNTVNGVGMAKKLSSDLHFEYGEKPRPYAIFSKSGPSAAGHTGVILGVDEKNKKVVVGEASCSSGQSRINYEPSAREYSFDDIKSWDFAYTDKFLKGGLSGV